jgi:hypothetical protein
MEIMNRRMIDLIKAGATKEEVATKLKVDDLGWSDTVSSVSFRNSIPGYYDEMTAVVAAQTARGRAQ